MNILLLGGSNAGMRDGWAAQFAAKAGAHIVENRFLGAVGSLYGLMALLKLERERATPPDLVIFEYCLNDILLLDADVLQPPLIVDALDAVASFCARKRIALLFLCLEPRPEPTKSRKAAGKVQPLYADAAARGAIPCLWLREIFAGALAPAHFQDENHLTPDASARVADAVIAAINAGVVAPGEPSEDPEAHFDYVDASQATMHGPCRLRHVSSKVFDGEFLEISRGGWSYWRGQGRLVGLMLQSTDRSGLYSIRSRDRMFWKNPRSQMQDVVRNLMLLHYTTRRIAVDGEVEIGMPVDELALTREPEDRTLLAAPSIAPFETQTLDIHGVIFWRPRRLLARMRDFLRRS